MENLTVIIHTYNEEEKIADAIDSAYLVSDKVIVIDMESQDKTTDIAKKKGAHVYQHRFCDYVEPSREFGINKAETDWVMILDADEVITKELASEVKKFINGEFTHFRILRKNIFGKAKWLKHGGWWPDSQIRLINKKSFKSWPKNIHSTPVIEGAQGLINIPILHFFHGDIESMVKKTVIFENIESNLLHKAVKKSNTPIFFRKFLGELGRRLFIKKGFMDGDIGIIESIYQAFSKTITYLYLYEKNRSI